MEEASLPTSASGKLGSGSPPASSEMARTALKNSSGDSSNRQTSTPLLLPSSPSCGAGGAAIAGEGGQRPELEESGLRGRSLPNAVEVDRRIPFSSSFLAGARLNPHQLPAQREGEEEHRSSTRPTADAEREERGGAAP